MSDDMVKSRNDVEIVDHEQHLGDPVDPDDKPGRLIDAYATALDPDDPETIPGVDPDIEPGEPTDGGTG